MLLLSPSSSSISEIVCMVDEGGGDCGDEIRATRSPSCKGRLATATSDDCEVLCSCYNKKLYNMHN